MTTTPVNKWGVGAALAVSAIGATIVWLGSGYSLGQASRIGPGFFPVIVGSFIVLLSIGLVIEALRDRTVTKGIQFRPFACVMASILAFAVLMERAGMLPATVCLMGLSAMAESPFRPLRTLLLAIFVSFMGVAIFVWALGLPLQSVRW